MNILSKDAILAADDLPRETVHVPEWGGDVYVRTMSGTDRDAFETSLIARRFFAEHCLHVDLEAQRLRPPTLDLSVLRAKARNAAAKPPRSMT